MPTVIHHHATPVANGVRHTLRMELDQAALDRAHEAIRRNLERHLMGAFDVPGHLFPDSTLSLAATTTPEPLTLKVLEDAQVRLLVEHPQTHTERLLARRIKELEGDLAVAKAELKAATAHHAPDNAPALGGRHAKE